MSTLLNARFELGENQCFQGEYSWRLKDGELRYRGTGHYQGLIDGRISASERQVQRFAAVLDLLTVWEWRRDYEPEDVGHTVLDGGIWWFNAELNGRSVRAAGNNAYPTYEDPKLTTTDEERFALLRKGLYDAFSIEAYIVAAQRQAEYRQQVERDRAKTAE